MLRYPHELLAWGYNGLEINNLVNKAFMLHVLSLPVGSAGVAVVTLPSDTFSSGFCFFSLP